MGAGQAERSWNRVVREGSEESSARGPVFNAPFVPRLVPAGQGREELRREEVAPVSNACFLEYSEEMGAMEEELQRAVVVTITGTRPAVGLADAAAALHAEFGVGPDDMSIRAFAPEDFLVLCSDVRLRDRMTRRGRAIAPWFTLSLRPWLRQAQATAVPLPYLVPLDLLGVPAHAWSRRTADVVFEGTGFVVDVAAPTARRHDMSCFRVWVRTDSPDRIPASRFLFVEEPPVVRRPMGRHRGPAPRRRAKTFRYLIRIRRVRDPVVAAVSDSPPATPSPPPSPPSSSSSERAAFGDRAGGAGGSRHAGASSSGACLGAEAAASGSAAMDGLEESVLAPMDGLESSVMAGRTSPVEVGAGGRAAGDEDLVVVGDVQYVRVQISNTDGGVGDVEKGAGKAAQSVPASASVLGPVVQQPSVAGSAVGSGPVLVHATVEGTVSSCGSAVAGPLDGGSSGHEVFLESSPQSVVGPCRRANEGGDDSVVASLRGGCGWDLVKERGQGPLARAITPSASADDGGVAPLFLEAAAGGTGQVDGMATPPASLRSFSAPVSPAIGFATPAREEGCEANIRAVISQLRQHIAAPVLPLPDVQRGRRRKLFIAEEDRRRSARIAAKAPCNTTTYMKKAQKVLMTRLGICNVEGEPPVDCLAKYAQFFLEPMSSVRIEALANLFFLDATSVSWELGA